LAAFAVPGGATRRDGTAALPRRADELHDRRTTVRCRPVMKTMHDRQVIDFSNLFSGLITIMIRGRQGDCTVDAAARIISRSGSYL
jgi:hypothetical protein